MSEQEKLQEYVKQNAVTEPDKRKGKKSGAKEVVKSNPDAKTPMGWYIGDTIYFCFRRALFTVGVTMLGTLIVTSGEAFGDDKFIYIYLFAGGLWLALIATRLLAIPMYSKLVNGKLYPIKGWDEFFTRRTETFWKGAYTNIRIVIKLTSEATDLHRQAVSSFYKKWASDWRDQYKKGAWESGRPNDFTSDGKSINGDINKRGLHKIIRKLTTELPALAEVLGKHLETAVIESSSRETYYDREKDERDAYDDQQ